MHSRLGVPLNGLLQLGSRGKGEEGYRIGKRKKMGQCEWNRHKRRIDTIKGRRNGKVVECQERPRGKIKEYRKKEEKGVMPADSRPLWNSESQAP